MFWISQSLIKEFFNRWEDVEHCPYQVFRTSIKKDVEDGSLSTLKEQYFETHAIGSGAFGNVEDLPRKKNGQKTIDHVRIDDALLSFKQESMKRMLVLNDYNTQVELKLKLNDEFGLIGHIDIFPAAVMERGVSSIAFIDLNLAEDITKTWGDYCWGRPHLLDITQMMCYHTLIRGMENEYNDFASYPPELLKMAREGSVKGYYWVFGYRKEGFLPLELEYTPIRLAEFKENLRRTMSLITMYEAQNWPKAPGKLCHSCPVLDCEMKSTTMKI